MVDDKYRGDRNHRLARTRWLSRAERLAESHNRSIVVEIELKHVHLSME